MLFILPIGIVLYFYDKKIYKQNIETFNIYVEKILASDLEDDEKLSKIDTMYYNNGYTVKRDGLTLHLCKKHFNPGVLLIFFGVGSYFGPLLYALYFFKFLKPNCHIVKI